MVGESILLPVLVPVCSVFTLKDGFQCLWESLGIELNIFVVLLIQKHSELKPSQANDSYSEGILNIFLSDLNICHF